MLIALVLSAVTVVFVFFIAFGTTQETKVPLVNHDIHEMVGKFLPVAYNDKATRLHYQGSETNGFAEWWFQSADIDKEMVIESFEENALKILQNQNPPLKQIMAEPSGKTLNFRDGDHERQFKFGIEEHTINGKPALVVRMEWNEFTER